MFLPDLEVKIWVKSPPCTEGAARALPHAGRTKGSQTLTAALIFWAGLVSSQRGVTHKDKAPQAKCGLGAEDCVQKSAGNGFSHSLWIHFQSPWNAVGFYSQPLTCFGFHFMLPPIPPCLEPTKLQNIGVFSMSWACSGHLTDHIVSPSFTATPSRNSQLLFPTRNGPETEDAALGRDKH